MEIIAIGKFPADGSMENCMKGIKLEIKMGDKKGGIRMDELKNLGCPGIYRRRNYQ